MEIEKGILKKLHIEKYTVAGKFFSRRNEVYKIQAKANGKDFYFVIKKYREGNIEVESSYLTRLSGLNVPKILAQFGNVLCLEYLDGITLLDALETYETQNKPFAECISLWLRFMQGFYAQMPGTIYGDINLRNFIMRPEGLYAIDMEEIKPGKKETDFGRMIAFILTYNPAFTDYKKDIVKQFLTICNGFFKTDNNVINAEMQMELDRMKTRRSCGE